MKRKRKGRIGFLGRGRLYWPTSPTRSRGPLISTAHSTYLSHAGPSRQPRYDSECITLLTDTPTPLVIPVGASTKCADCATSFLRRNRGPWTLPSPLVSVCGICAASCFSTVWARGGKPRSWRLRRHRNRASTFREWIDGSVAMTKSASWGSVTTSGYKPRPSLWIAPLSAQLVTEEKKGGKSAAVSENPFDRRFDPVG
jgi:hypothetical protein